MARIWESWQATHAQRLQVRDPVPVLSAAVSEATAVRAALVAPGILMEGMSSSDRLTRLTATFDRSGGTGAKVLIRRVWLGHLPEVLVRKQRAVYESYADPKADFGRDESIASTDPAEIVGRLGELVAETGADALNLRVQLPGMAPEVIREQIEMIGREVVRPLKRLGPTAEPAGAEHSATGPTTSKTANHYVEDGNNYVKTATTTSKTAPLRVVLRLPRPARRGVE